MKKPILVVLAAGMGSRYGGLKQLDAVGGSGEVLLDYSVFDAARAGFGKAVFIIRHDFEEDFKKVITSRMEAHIECELVFQEIDSIVPACMLQEAKKAGRSKPWGTAHALLCAESAVDAPFAVINADDFYGREAFSALGGFLASDDAAVNGAIVPYRLQDTLSARGAVTRGVCKFEGGFLLSVDELKSIERKEGGIFNTAEDGEKRLLSADTPVSMNFWGFPPSIFKEFHSYFSDFLTHNAQNPKSECYIPLAVDELVKNSKIKIRSLEAASSWFGVTYKEDKKEAVEKIAKLISEKVYPEELWA